MPIRVTSPWMGLLVVDILAIFVSLITFARMHLFLYQMSAIDVMLFLLGSP